MIARMLATARFPRAAVVVEILAIAELCRGATRALEGLAENAANYEPGSLRRLAHGLVRELVAEVAGQVTL
jgi:hypothetical protein